MDTPAEHSLFLLLSEKKRGACDCENTYHWGILHTGIRPPIGGHFYYVTRSRDGLRHLRKSDGEAALKSAVVALYIGYAKGDKFDDLVETLKNVITEPPDEDPWTCRWDIMAALRGLFVAKWKMPVEEQEKFGYTIHRFGSPEEAVLDAEHAADKRLHANGPRVYNNADDWLSEDATRPAKFTCRYTLYILMFKKDREDGCCKNETYHWGLQVTEEVDAGSRPHYFTVHYNPKKRGLEREHLHGEETRNYMCDKKDLIVGLNVWTAPSLLALVKEQSRNTEGSTSRIWAMRAVGNVLDQIRLREGDDKVKLPPIKEIENLAKEKADKFTRKFAGKKPQHVVFNKRDWMKPRPRPGSRPASRSTGTNSSDSSDARGRDPTTGDADTSRARSRSKAKDSSTGDADTSRARNRSKVKGSSTEDAPRVVHRAATDPTTLPMRDAPRGREGRPTGRDHSTARPQAPPREESPGGLDRNRVLRGAWDDGTPQEFRERIQGNRHRAGLKEFEYDGDIYPTT